MRRDDIIPLAREVGASVADIGASAVVYNIPPGWLVRFARRVATAEREACIAVSMRHSHRDDDMGAIIANAMRSRT